MKIGWISILIICAVLLGGKVMTLNAQRSAPRRDSNAPTSGITWVAAHNGEVPDGAILAGVETDGANNGVPNYVCRTWNGKGGDVPPDQLNNITPAERGDVHPGKLVGGACNIGYGGKEIEKPFYEVAVGDGEWVKPAQECKDSGTIFSRNQECHVMIDRMGNAVVGGGENGAPLWVCRIRRTPDTTKFPTIKMRNGQEVPSSYQNEHAGKLLPDGHCHFVTDPASRHLYFNYGTNSNLIASVTSDLGLSLSYNYDNQGRLIKVTKPDLTTLSFQYDSSSRITAVLDNDGKVLESHTYDTYGRGLTSARAGGVQAVTVSYPTQ